LKYFFGYLFLFLAFLVLLVAIARPDLLDAAILTTGAVLVALAWTLVAGAGLCLTVGAGLLAWWWYRRTTVESLRQRDGHYPIQRVRVAGGRTVFIDPNQTIGPAIMVDRRTGEIYEHEPAAGWQIQATVRGMVEQTRRAQAMFQGDASRATVHGSQSRGDRLTAPAARLIAGAYDRQNVASEFNTAPAVDSTSTAIVEAPRVLSAREGFGANTNTQLVMGQTADGQLVMWNMLDTPHLRLHGKTQGSGKTNLAQTLAAGAARTGAHVVILDRRRFKDWQEFAGVAELIDSTDPRRFAAAVRALQAVYQDRDRLLGAAGAPNIARLPQRLQRIVAVVSEFGALCNVAAGEGVLDQVLDPLKMILREAGAAGVHVVLEDQAADKWPMGIAANAEPVTGYLPLNYGAAGGYHYAHKLPPYSFHFAGAVFKTWHMAPELRGLLAAAPDLAGPIVEGRSTVPVQPPGVGLPEVERQNGTQNGAQERNAGTPGPDDPGRWDDVVAAWFATHPAALTGPARGISDLARAMCRDNEGGNDANYEAYKGRAHKLFHEFRAAVRLPGGQPLSTDITGGTR
jgi:uncharacterized MnhB-related membrane protein